MPAGSWGFNSQQLFSARKQYLHSHSSPSVYDAALSWLLLGCAGQQDSAKALFIARLNFDEYSVASWSYLLVLQQASQGGSSSRVVSLRVTFHLSGCRDAFAIPLPAKLWRLARRGFEGAFEVPATGRRDSVVYGEYSSRRLQPVPCSGYETPSCVLST